MIKEETVDVHMSYRNITRYKELGYQTKLHETIQVKVIDLAPVSHQKITAICDNCGAEKVIAYHKYLENEKRCGYYGCKRCSNNKREITSLERFGVTNYAKTDECKEKTSKNNMIKYGVKTTLLEKNTMKKIKDTVFERYGVDEILSSKDVIEKGKKTNIEKYGFDHYAKSLFFYDNTYKRWKSDVIYKLNRYNITDYILKDDRTIDIKCDCGLDHYFNTTSKILYQRKEIQHNILCTVCNSVISQKQSGKEIQILNFIKENYNGVILENDKTIVSELDIYLPELKLAIEFNGLYWHSDIYKEHNYHLNKTENCEKKGIQLIHIWEDEWIYKQDIVKSMILNKLGKTYNKIYARKTEIKEIFDTKLIREFLDNNHIQGFVGSKVKIGLFYENELMSLMTLGNRRVSMGKKTTTEGEYELLRFCNKLNTNIIGGASKLFNYFIKNYNINEIISYADRSHSKGKLYETLGFEYLGKTVPNYSYYDSKCNKYNRFNFRKDVLIEKGYDKNKT